MTTKLSAIFELFQKGYSVANPALWKQGQVTATALAGAIIAIDQLLIQFGVNVPISEAQVSAIAGGIIAMVNIVLTVTTTDKIGLPSIPQVSSTQSNESGGDGELTEKSGS